MHTIISHTTALAFLDKCARNIPDPAHRVRPEPFEGAFPEDIATSKHELLRFHLDRFEREGNPTDVLVPDESRRRQFKGFKHHAMGGVLPEGSLLDAGGGVLVCSAPLLFVQLCRGMPLMRCIKLGHFICGTYSKEPSVRSGVVGRRPLATQAELAEFVRAAHHLRGSRNAAAALPWILDGAASPQETELALPFYLPKRMGGFGFEAPKMNFEEPLSAQARSIEGSYNAKIDVYWPDQKIGLEYNSYAEHSEPYKIGRDERRKLALQVMKIRVELVTEQQLADPQQLAVLAQMLADRGVPKVL